MDVPQMATCVPGVSEVIATGEDQYAGRMKVTFGPIRLTLQGQLSIQELDQTHWRVQLAERRQTTAALAAASIFSAELTLVEQERGANPTGHPDRSPAHGQTRRVRSARDSERRRIESWPSSPGTLQNTSRREAPHPLPERE